MISRPPRIAAQRTLHDGWTRLLGLTLDLGEGRTARREVEHHGDAAAVLPFDPERRVACLVELLRAPLLYRHGLAVHLEAPAGLLEPGETAASTILREAQEEVGLALAELEPVGHAFTSPGLSTEAVHLYLAAYGERDRVGEGGGLATEHEDIRPREIALTELWRALEGGELTDMKTITLLYALRHRRPALFA